METINSVTQSASKLIFGENPEQTQKAQPSTEPISGETGKGTVDEPYDAGNKQETPGSSSSTPPKQSEHPVQHEGSKSEQKSEGSKLDDQPVQKPVDGENPADGSAAQQTPADKEPKDEGAELLAKRDPNDHSGEPMHMHEGKEKSDTAGEGEGEEEKSEEQKKKEQEEKGTGEKWVKSTGLAADGGDFDATKPGAGREADRLLEQKGVHKGDSSEGASTHSSKTDSKHDAKADSKDDTKKPGMKEKIKEKLHIGSSKQT